MAHRDHPARLTAGAVLGLGLLAQIACGSNGNGPSDQPRYALKVVTQPDGASGGAPFTSVFSVEVLDAAGARATGVVLDVTVVLSGGDPGATLQGTHTVHSVAGLATFPELKINLAASGYLLTASANSATPVTSNPFAVLVGPASAVSSTLTVSAPILLVGDSSFVSVVARDLGGNRVAGATVTLSLGAGTADVSLGPVVDSGNGTYTAKATAIGAGGPRVLSFQFGGGAPFQSNQSLKVSWFVDVSISNLHGCGLLNSGEAYCWGRDMFGEIGAGTPSTRVRPEKVMGDIVWKYVGAGGDMTCGLDLGGKAYCWGSSISFGTGSIQTQPLGHPLPIDGNWTFASLSVGWALGACGVLTTHETVCWGSNNFGQTGNAPFSDGRLPAQVPTTATFAATGRGIFASCGITATGAPYCWGANATGLLGVADSALPDLCGLNFHCSAQPLQISSPVALVPASLSVGASHACGLNQTGDAYCWGNGGANNGQASPVVPLTTGKTFTQLVTAGNNYCGLASDQKTYCWGNNNYGQTGTGTAGADVAAPTPVSGNFHFTRLAAGAVNICAVEANGRIYCWGNNLETQVGDGTTDDRWVPTLVRSFN